MAIFVAGEIKYVQEKEDLNADNLLIISSGMRKPEMFAQGMKLPPGRAPHPMEQARGARW